MLFLKRRSFVLSKKSADELGPVGVGCIIQISDDRREVSITMECPDSPFESSEEIYNALQCFIDNGRSEDIDLFDLELPEGNKFGEFH